MANGKALAGVSLSEEVRSAFTVLGDDEYRRWRDSCRALEGAHEYPWAEGESRALVASVLGCMFGEGLARLDTPSRTWAATNSTMAVFTRRLGCLRELIGQEGVFNGPDATMRVQKIFDRVTIVGTEAALAALTYAGAPKAVGAPTEPMTQTHEVAPQPSPSAEPTTRAGEVAPVDSPSPETAEGTGRPAIRRRTAAILLAVAVAALVTSLVFALSPAAARHHPRPHGGHVTGASNGTPPSTAPTGPGSGSHSTYGGPGATTGGAAHGSSPGPTSPVSSGPGVPSASGSGGGSGGSGNAPGGSTGLTLPGGTPVTVPQVTTPGVTVPGGSTVTTTSVTLPHL
jgi:hypothetical protein